MMRVSALEGHRLWAPVYDASPNPLLALERRAMCDLLRPLNPARVIDVACGTGRCPSYFQRAGSQIFGIDASEHMLREAERRAPIRGRVVIADAKQLPFHDSVADLILCSMALGYFDDIHQVFCEVARVSRPGASIAVSDLHPKALAAGWTRSFNIGQLRYEMDHFCRSLEEVQHAASDAGLLMIRCSSEYLGDLEYAVFEEAGKQELFEKVRFTPALFVGLWKKPC